MYSSYTLRLRTNALQANSICFATGTCQSVDRTHNRQTVLILSVQIEDECITSKLNLVFQPCTLNLWTECITGKLNMFVLVLSVQIEDECIISKLNLVRSKLQSHFDGSVQMEEVSEAFHLLCRHTREGR